MIEEPGRVILVEAKAGVTVTSDMLKSVNKVGQIMAPLAEVERFVSLAAIPARSAAA